MSSVWEGICSRASICYMETPITTAMYCFKNRFVAYHTFQQNGCPTSSHHLMALGIFAYCWHSNETAQPLPSPSVCLSWGVIWLYMERWCALGIMSGTGEIWPNRPWSWLSHNWHSRLNLEHVVKINDLNETTLLIVCHYGSSIDNWCLFVFS